MIKNLQNNINEYNVDIFRNKFQATEIYKSLCKDFTEIVFSDNLDYYSRIETPRQKLGVSRFSAVPFYFLEYLTKHNPVEIYDLGCGWNAFKKYIPNIIGVGAEDNKNYFFGDILDYVNKDYILRHQNFFDSVFSICALHFIPLSNIRERVVDFVSMIKPNGHGFLAMNLQRMIDHDQSFRDRSLQDIEVFVRTELYDIPAEYQVFDLNFSTVDQWLDGNIRMVVHKK